MPKEVVERLNKELTAALKRPEVRENLAKQAFDPRGSSSEEFAGYMREQLEIWGKAIRDSGITPE
jgi:tripartite-type tricarboxylate transporter receptor subunit TctC